MKIYREVFQVVMLAGFVSLVVGCANAISYHHSERISIAVEARTTDPTAPVQGTIGVRSRTVVVSPRQEKTSGDSQEAGEQKTGLNSNSGKSNTGNPGESASVVSDFNLERDGQFLGRTVIESAFITGDATKDVPPSTMNAITGLGSGAINELSELRRELLNETYRYLSELAEKGNEQAVKLKTDLDALWQRAPIASDISNKKFYQLDNNNLKDVPGSDLKLRQDFIGVLDFIKEIEVNLAYLKKTFDNRTVTYNMKVIGDDELKTLKISQKNFNDDRNEFFRNIGNDPVINEAVAYINKNI